MSILQKVAEIVNRRMEEKADQILTEVKDAGYKYYPGSQHVVPSFHIMDKDGGGEVSGSFRAGFLTRVRIGSDLREAYWAVYGNGGKNVVIYPKHKSYTKNGNRRTPMLGKYPSGIPGYGWLPSVHGYNGHDFVKEVANRHR